MAKSSPRTTTSLTVPTNLLDSEKLTDNVSRYQHFVSIKSEEIFIAGHNLSHTKTYARGSAGKYKFYKNVLKPPHSNYDVLFVFLSIWGLLKVHS